MNILSNALKYTPDGGLIEVSASAGQDAVVLTIKDNGQGMTKRELDHAMEPFNQVESAVLDANMGTGLGLPIVRELTDSMQVSLGFQSRKGIGTTVSLGFPTIESGRGLSL